MEKTRIRATAESAIGDCLHLRNWVIKHDSGNKDLIGLVGEVEELLLKISKQEPISK